MKFIKTYKIPLLLTLVLFVFHLLQKDFNSAYEHPIAGDAQAYYAYLPAVFIYADLKYDFVEKINAKYYPPEQQKSFLKPVGEGKVNKTFPGVAILYLPFFFLAHALALLFGLEADGYSTIYQVCFDLGLWFYLGLALIFLQKTLLLLNFSLRSVNWSSALIVLGTNVFFYSVYDQSVTHIYNFFLVNLFIYTLLSYKEGYRFSYLGWAFFLLALMGITRPTNILVLGLLLFIIPDFNFYKALVGTIFKLKNFVKIAVIVLPILSLPFILWKIQTGNWVVYSYGEEGFDFAHPHFREFLFSYLKGWFTYTPIAFFILLAGFIILFRQNKSRFFIGLGLLFTLVFVFSSWWCWYYGAGMSQRVMIDFGLLLAFFVCLIIDHSDWFPAKFSLKKLISISLIFLLMTINVVQAYQIRHGILAGGSATQFQYWDNFLVLEKRARVYPHDHWVLEEEQELKLNIQGDTTRVKGVTFQDGSDWIIHVNESDHYSATLKTDLHRIRKGSKIIFGFEALASSEIKETRAVVLYDNETFVYGLDLYLKQNEWVKIEFMIEPTVDLINSPRIYFWNGGSAEKVDFRNFNVAHYFSEEYL